MVLITGGVYQGKEEFAREHFQIRSGADGNRAEINVLYQADLIRDFHLWIAGELRAGRDPWKGTEEILEKNPDVVITVAELGCGIVPADAFDRNWREVTGRICCLLAKKARAVYRVTCGIGTKLV